MQILAPEKSSFDMLIQQVVDGLRPARTEEQNEEWEKCRDSCEYFIGQFVQIYDATSKVWLPFELWQAQSETLQVLIEEKLVAILKARQLGFSWLVLAYALWLMLFHPAATVSIFSKRDEEAAELLDFRMKGMHERLPLWLQQETRTDAQHKWHLANGSRALAFPTTGGRSYTSTLVIVDEADYIPDLSGLINAVKPTIDAGGQMVMLSTPDKEQPQSLFKKIYMAAKKALNEYRAIFYGWRARPDRTDEWYEKQKRDSIAKTASLDDLHQEYPENDIQALAPNSQDKRLPQEWLLNCYKELTPLPRHNGPSLPQLLVFEEPIAGVEYVIGADPAEGNPTSDDSSASVVDKKTGEEVALLCGAIEPKVFGAHLVAVASWYNNASVLVERNNHGHAVIGWLQDNSPQTKLLEGTDEKPGWLTTSASKAVMYSDAADMFRQGDAKIHNQDTYLQLSSIEGATLRAPKEEHDDKATGFVLGLVARSRTVPPPPPARSHADVRITERAGSPFVRQAIPGRNKPGWR